MPLLFQVLKMNTGPLSALREVGILDHILSEMQRRDRARNGGTNTTEGEVPSGSSAFLDSVQGLEDVGLKYSREDQPPVESLLRTHVTSDSNESLSAHNSGGEGGDTQLAGSGGWNGEKALRMATGYWGNLGAVVAFVRSMFQVRRCRWKVHGRVLDCVIHQVKY